MLKDIQDQKKIKPRSINFTKIRKKKMEFFIRPACGQINRLRGDIVTIKLAIAA